MLQESFDIEFWTAAEIDDEFVKSSELIELSSGSKFLLPSTAWHIFGP